jgi:hypothetical protein
MQNNYMKYLIFYHIVYTVGNQKFIYFYSVEAVDFLLTRKSTVFLLTRKYL